LAELTAMPCATAQAPDGQISEGQLAAGSNRLGTAVWRALLPRDGSRSVAVAPYSLATAMAMLAAGARGDTARDLAAALGVPGAGSAAIADAHAALREALVDVRQGTGLRIANGMWLASRLDPAPAYVALVQRAFAAEAVKIDFAASDAIPRINDWVRSASGGMIPTMLERLDQDVELLLIDAVAFKGSWINSFDSARTAARPFRRADGRTSDVPMMTRTGRVEYAQLGPLHAIALPYQGDRLEMVVVAPTNAAAIVALAAAPTSAMRFVDRSVPFARREVELWLPRFRIAFGGDVTAALRTAGMESAFTRGADFGGITDDHPILPSSVVHRVAIEVNEEGTEAAAATAVQIPPPVSIPPTPTQFHADLPFVLAIRDWRSGIILFIALVADPSRV
jgi:serpin B